MESTFANRVKQFRQHKGLSQQAFAEQCGLTQGNIAHMENGTEPKQSNVSKLTAGFPDLNPDWLLNGNGPMLRDGRTLTAVPADQLPPQVPSKHEVAEPSQPYWRVASDSEELKQVKSERDNLREQVSRLLNLLESATPFARPSAAGGKTEASADAATSLQALTDRIFVDGLVRYPQAEEMEESHEGAHYSIDGERLAA